ncbi:MAG: hypothetical protein HY908_09325 [Myxococcales bacterium]|nr:hypothetical protein [Myxococcales bacterium]
MSGPARLVLCLAATCGVVACSTRHDATANHGDHPHEAAELEPVAITRWTDDYELFVEFPAPRPGEAVTYHAHVTKLDGFQAVTTGRFDVRFETPSGVAAEAGIEGVKRPGIFTPEGPAPAAGSYRLAMSYEHEGRRAVFDCGAIDVSAHGDGSAPEGGPGAITFLKESQWKIPFATARAAEHAIARDIELAATVEAAGGSQLTIGAPIGGLFFHDPQRGLSEGREIRVGEVLGTIVPTVAGDDYGRLEFAVEEAALEREQTVRELGRLEPLVKDGLLPERRLVALRGELASLDARLAAAKRRLGRVLAPGGASGLPVRSTIAGLIAEVAAANGAPVDAGATLLRVAGTGKLWIRARFVARPPAGLAGAAPSALRLPSGERIALEKAGARLLSPLPAIEAESRIATWIVELDPAAPDASTATAPRSHELRPGSSAVLSLRVGAPRVTLVVPRSAVVEINTRPFVFVQVDGEHFEKRAVSLGDSAGDLVELTAGVSPGEHVVTRGGFDVHLASLMGTVESHRH